MAGASPATRGLRRRPPPPPSGWVERVVSNLVAPIDALTASIYSILIVLTFTLSVAIAKRWPDTEQPIPEGFGTELFLAVLGAAVAWGLIDGLMLALLSVLSRGEKHRFLQTLQAAESDDEAVAVIADELDYVLEPIAGESKRALLYADVLDHLRDSSPRPVGFQREDLVEGLGTALVAVVAVLPSLVPLWMLRGEPLLALRVSNIVSFVVLFALGYRWGVHAGANRWKTGLVLVLAAAGLTAIAIPLGG